MKSGSFLKRALVVGAACAALFGAPASQATITGTLTVNSLVGEGVSITYNGATEGTTAGTFYGTFPDASNNIYFWCIDLTHVVNVGGSYTPFNADPFQTNPPLNFTATQVQDLRNLFFESWNAAVNTDAAQAAAFQLAIWDVLFDDSAFSLTSNIVPGTGFTATSGDAALIPAAQILINKAVNPPAHPYPLTQLTQRFATTDNHVQDFIYQTPPSQTPEPTGVALLGAGLVAMMFAMRRRRIGGHAV
jgi:hypothetical protein